MSLSTIEAFFHERKEAWLKQKIKKSMDEETVQRLHEEAEEKFLPEHWLPDAARRAGQMSMATHPCTFSHPSSRKNKNGDVTPVICEAPPAPDGLLRCGNVKNAQTDALGNAAVLDVHKFLDLLLDDGKKVIEHIRDESPLARKLLDIATESYENLRDGFLAMIGGGESETVTSSKIKQVYFPIARREYHLLSILTNSGIVFELKEHIDHLRYSDEAKAAREARKEGKCIEPPHYKELFELTVIGYGGTKPQNISVLNNRYGGKAYLLSSLPPKIERREIRFPKKDFFTESLPYRKVRDILKGLDAIITTDYNNVDIRRGRKYRYEQLMDLIITQMMRVRSVSFEQCREENSRLPEYQKIWLCEQYREQRETQDTWLDELIDRISRWILHQIERNTRRKGLKLGPAELADIRESVEASKEALR